MKGDETITLRFGNNRTVPVHVLRSDRKTLSISVLPNQSVEATAPRNASLLRIEEKLEKRLEWILRQLAFFEALRPAIPPRKYVTGETHYYLGRQHRLKICRGDKPAVRLRGKALLVTIKAQGDPDLVRKLVETWYRERAINYFERKFRELSETLPGAPCSAQLRVRRMKLRWGSCTSSGTITLNTDLIKAPSHCIEYVIVHELCHLIHPHHGAAFQRLLQRLLPDWERRKHRLERFRF